MSDDKRPSPETSTPTDSAPGTDPPSKPDPAPDNAAEPVTTPDAADVTGTPEADEPAAQAPEPDAPEAAATDADESGDSAESADLPDSADSAESTELAEPDEPAESTEPADSAESAEPDEAGPEQARPAQPQPALPDRWLVLQVSAALQAVAATNYTCFGSAPVPRYGELIPETPDLPDLEPGTLCAELFIRASDESLRFAELDARFKPLEESERQMVWQWYDPARRLHVFWVWDFFRLQSHVVLRAGLPAPEIDPDETWAATVAAMRAILPGDILTIKVQSACGNIHQPHPITAAAGEWSPS